MTTTVIILHFGSIATTKQSLKALSKKISSHNLIIVNNTKDQISDLAKIIPGTKVLESGKNLGFAAGVNIGIRKALQDKHTDSVMLFNNDLELTHGTIDMLRKTLFEKDNIGIVSPVLHHSGNQYDWGGKYSKWTGNAKHQNFEQKPKRNIQVDHVAGAAMLIKREVIELIGGFDERYFLYFEDLDFCLKVSRAGYMIIIDSQVVAEHAVSSSSTPLKRTLWQWKSHLLFILSHLPRVVYPTAILYNLLFYPLIIAKIILKGNR